VLFERVRIGRHARVRRCIVDKDVEIPQGAEIGFNLEADRQHFFVTDEGLVVIPKRAKLEEIFAHELGLDGQLETSS
jgi:glucose-1-phosphate adenylyltransferase